MGVQFSTDIKSKSDLRHASANFTADNRYRKDALRAVSSKCECCIFLSGGLGTPGTTLIASPHLTSSKEWIYVLETVKTIRSVRTQQTQRGRGFLFPLWTLHGRAVYLCHESARGSACVYTNLRKSWFCICTPILLRFRYNNKPSVAHCNSCKNPSMGSNARGPRSLCPCN